MEAEEVSQHSIHTEGTINATVKKEEQSSKIEDAYEESFPKVSDGAPAESGNHGISEQLEGTARGSGESQRQREPTDSDSKTVKATDHRSSMPQSGKRNRIGGISSEVVVNNIHGLSMVEGGSHDDLSEKRRSALKDALKNSRPSSNIKSNAVTNDQQELSHHITDRSQKILIKSMMKDSLAQEGLPEEYEDENFEESQQAPSGGREQREIKAGQRSHVVQTNRTQSNDDKYSDEQQFEQPAAAQTTETAAHNEAAAK